MDYFWDACYSLGLTNRPSLASIPVFPEYCQRDLYQYYDVSPEIIGQGSFGYVRRVKLLPNATINKIDNDGVDSSSKDAALHNCYYACKTIPKSNHHNRSLFLQEVYNLNRCQKAASTGLYNNEDNSNFVIRLVDVIEDRSAIHIITELCQGGELYDYVVKEHRRTGRGLRGKALSPSSSHGDNCGDDDDDELRCATVIFQILTAFETIHERACVCHRDMKASNFVFVRKPSFIPNSLNLRVIDFGLSKFVGKEPEKEKRVQKNDNERKQDDPSTILPERKSPSLNANGVSEKTASCEIEDDNPNTYSKQFRYMTSGVGSPYYVAPEVLIHHHQQHERESSIASTKPTEETGNNEEQDDLFDSIGGGYTTKCDIWSIGVLAFLTLTGTLPVIGKDEEETVQKLMDPEMEVDFSDDTVWEQHHLKNNDSDKAPNEDNDNKHYNHTGSKDNKRAKPKISASAREFCETLLQRDPKKRPSAREALEFDWIVKHCGYSSLTPASPTDLGNSFETRLENRSYLDRLPSLSTQIP